MKEKIKKIDIHSHTGMWNPTYIQPECALATPEDLRESYRTFKNYKYKCNRHFSPGWI